MIRWAPGERVHYPSTEVQWLIDEIDALGFNCSLESTLTPSADLLLAMKQDWIFTICQKGKVGGWRELSYHNFKGYEMPIKKVLETLMKPDTSNG